MSWTTAPNMMGHILRGTDSAIESILHLSLIVGGSGYVVRVDLQFLLTYELVAQFASRIDGPNIIE